MRSKNHEWPAEFILRLVTIVLKRLKSRLEPCRGDTGTMPLDDILVGPSLVTSRAFAKTPGQTRPDPKAPRPENEMDKKGDTWQPSVSPTKVLWPLLGGTYL